MPEQPRPTPEETPRQVKEPVHQAPRRRVTRRRRHRSPFETPRPQAAPTERDTPAAGSTATPGYGISMESTSRAGSGPAMPTGNTLQIKPGKGPARRAGPIKPLAGYVPAYEVTRMPLPRGRCLGRYTDAARRAGVEGTVILDLVVSEAGVVTRVKVTKGLPHGLSAAAVRAARACRFTPGQRKGKPVPVKVRGFKVRFFLQTGSSGPWIPGG